jgi:hypothetical protein
MEATYLAMLIMTSIAIAVLSLYAIYKLFAGQR